jgi:alanine-synthesizing transaminase
MIYTREILEQFVELAKKYNLFLIADEIYANLAFNDSFVSLAEVSQDVPTMIMRGLSKEVPWPGSRCGWVEFYNTDKDEDFAKYAKSIEEAKMNEVCSTTLPQSVLPKILGDKRYAPHLENRRNKYIKRAKTAYNMFDKSKLFNVVKPKGAFYLSVTFSELFYQKLPQLTPMNEKARVLLEQELNKELDMPIDKKFCLQLLASTGICTVPLSSGFNSHIEGFRMTLLEENDDKFENTISRILDIAR